MRVMQRVEFMDSQQFKARAGASGDARASGIASSANSEPSSGTRIERNMLKLLSSPIEALSCRNVPSTGAAHVVLASVGAKLSGRPNTTEIAKTRPPHAGCGIILRDIAQFDRMVAA